MSGQNGYMEDILKQAQKYRDTKELLNQKIRETYRDNGVPAKERNRSRAKLNSTLAQLRRPVTHGEEYAAEAWSTGLRYTQGDLPQEPVLYKIGPTWVGDFVDAMRRAGIESFFYAGEGHGAFQSMMLFRESGCEFAGFSRVMTDDPLLSDHSNIDGIRFLIR